MKNRNLFDVLFVVAFILLATFAAVAQKTTVKPVIFAVLSDGRIQCRPVTGAENVFSVQPWHDVPGGMLTNTAVAASVVNGRLVLCALSRDQNVYLNELAPGGRYWSGWYQIPGGGSAPTLCWRRSRALRRGFTRGPNPRGGGR